MRKFKLVALVVVIVFGLMLAGCTTTETSTEEGAEGTEAKIAYFVGIMSGGAAWGQAQAGFEAACEELGWEGYYVAPSTPNDTVQMVQYTETAITNNADVILGTFYSEDIFGDAAQKAKDDGILLATTNCFISEDYQEFWIGTDPVGMGTTQAETLVNIVGDEKATVVYMQTIASTETQNEQFVAFEEYLADYDNITVYGQEYCNSDAIVAADKISSLVKANPEINACVAADSMGALGVANYVEEQELQDTFYSIGIDDSAELLNYVVAGALDCTIAQDFFAMGYESIMMLNDIMEGTKTYEFANDSGAVVIYSDDVESYATEKGIER